MTRSAFNVLFILLFILGVFVMFNSVSWGSDSANAFLRANGGSAVNHHLAHSNFF